MKRRQFEEILDECISAYLSGRRSVEDSLSLYPSIARELGPLLRAAADTADTFREMRPSPHVQERIRLSILRAASERAAARALTRQIDGFEARPSHRRYRLLSIPAAAVAVTAIVVSGLLLLGGGPSTESDSFAVSVVERPEFASDLTNARRQLDVLQLKAARGQTVTPADIEALLATTRRLAETAEPTELAAAEQVAVEEVLGEQLELLEQLSGEPRHDSEEIDDALAVTVSVAAVFGVSVTEPTQDNEPAVATASPVPSSDAGDTTQSSPSATPSVSPSPSPIPVSTPQN